MKFSDSLVFLIGAATATVETTSEPCACLPELCVANATISGSTTHLTYLCPETTHPTRTLTVTRSSTVTLNPGVFIADPGLEDEKTTTTTIARGKATVHLTRSVVSARTSPSKMADAPASSSSNVFVMPGPAASTAASSSEGHVVFSSNLPKPTPSLDSPNSSFPTLTVPTPSGITFSHPLWTNTTYTPPLGTLSPHHSSPSNKSSSGSIHTQPTSVKSSPIISAPTRFPRPSTATCEENATSPRTTSSTPSQDRRPHCTHSLNRRADALVEPTTTTTIYKTLTLVLQTKTVPPPPPPPPPRTSRTTSASAAPRLDSKTAAPASTSPAAPPWKTDRGVRIGRVVGFVAAGAAGGFLVVAGGALVVGRVRAGR